MGTVGEKVSNFFSGMFGTTAPAAAASTEKAIQPISPTVTTSAGAVKMGMGKEKSGYTSAGGRRLKTRRAKKLRKTRSRKH